jgi:hypothetical protein
MWHEWGKREMLIGFECEKPEGRRSLGNPRCRRVDNIKVDLKRNGLG